MIARLQADSSGLGTKRAGSTFPRPSFLLSTVNCRLSTVDCQLFLIHPAAHAAAHAAARRSHVLIFLFRDLADQRLSGEHE